MKNMNVVLITDKELAPEISDEFFQIGTWQQTEKWVENRNRWFTGERGMAVRREMLHLASYQGNVN